MHSPDKQKRDKAIDAFVIALKARLDAKEAEGYTGWDELKPEYNIAQRLNTKSIDLMIGTSEGEGTVTKDCLDIANFSFIIWYDQQQS